MVEQIFQYNFTELHYFLFYKITTSFGSHQSKYFQFSSGVFFVVVLYLEQMNSRTKAQK